MCSNLPAPNLPSPPNRCLSPEDLPGKWFGWDSSLGRFASRFVNLPEPVQVQDCPNLPEPAKNLQRTCPPEPSLAFITEIHDERESASEDADSRARPVPVRLAGTVYRSSLAGCTGAGTTSRYGVTSRLDRRTDRTAVIVAFGRWHVRLVFVWPRPGYPLTTELCRLISTLISTRYCVAAFS